MSKNQEYKVVGVDGCRGGWMTAVWDGQWQFRVFDKIEELVVELQPDLVLIDIPIGLQDESVSRQLETQARNYLKPMRHSSVFNPPVREAVYAENYEKACEINRKITGKAISIQAWNIVPKIREVDLFLSGNEAFSSRIFESHPELNFYFLHGQAMQEPKHKSLQQRVRILSRFDKKLVSAMKKFPKQGKRFGNDDLVDAACLGLVTKLGSAFEFHELQNSPGRDQHGLPISMKFFDPTRIPS